MNQKLAKMVKAIDAALKDDSCRERAEDLLDFVHKDLVRNSSNSRLAWMIMREACKSNPKTVSMTTSAFDTSDYRPLEKAAKILGIKVELPVEPPF